MEGIDLSNNPHCSPNFTTCGFEHFSKTQYLGLLISQVNLIFQANARTKNRPLSDGSANKSEASKSNCVKKQTNLGASTQSERSARVYSEYCATAHQRTIC